ncbi:MAG TPA: Rieske 2Fe-2S domain-containing protein [Actinomycetota bacterium]|nr:Rieske 2Fe-2S domain-containing protein [Actinomycetota bacterium]
MSGRRRPTRPSAIAFTATILASIGLTVVYVRGGQPQLEGALLAVAFGGLSVGLVFWAKRLMPHGPQVQEREVIPSQIAERPEAEEAFEEGAERIGRRRFLGRMLALAGAAIGVALVVPVRSLGERPGSSLFHTSWRAGSRAVTDAGQPVLAADLPVNTELTVFPEGAVGDAESQTLLIRLPAGDYHPLPGREDWAPDNVVAFSKVCTHAGCPVGLYRADTMELYCPCHQSVFEVLQGAKPSEGPATRPLPQLPLSVDADGYLVAQSDYTEPIGPGFWNRDRRG